MPRRSLLRRTSGVLAAALALAAAAALSLPAREGEGVAQASAPLPPVNIGIRQISDQAVPAILVILAHRPPGVDQRPDV